MPKSSKRSIKLGKCPTNIKMTEVIWLETGGATGQFHSTKLTIYHFDQNAHSRMNVSLAMQLFSASVAAMIRDAIKDEEVRLPFENRNIYNHLADLCQYWDVVVDICNGRDGPHSPDNASDRQHMLLHILNWFTKWRALHDDLVEEGKATEYNFFADETWFCIRALRFWRTCQLFKYIVLGSV